MDIVLKRLSKNALRLLVVIMAAVAIRGTIADKLDFVIIRCPSNKDPIEYINELIEQYSKKKRFLEMRRRQFIPH